jgi:hypothetical protein
MLGRRGSHRTVVCAAIALGALAVPGVANAAPRFVTTTGTSGNNCQTIATACDLATAIHGTGGNVPNDGDEVIVEPGNYSLAGPVSVGASNLNIHGALDQPRPVINETSTGEIQVFFGGSISYLDFESSGNAPALGFSGAVAERLFLRGSWGGGAVCQCEGIVRDSVIVATGGGIALGIVSNGGAASGEYRNVTAWSTNMSGPAIEIERTGALATLAFDAYNTVARTVAGGTDVVADGQGTSITFHHSNYGTSAQNSSGVVQDAPSDPHQTAAPQFANAGAGDFSELAGSPTIDAGLNDPLNGPTDYAGNARTLGAATDIGAFEFVPPAPPANPTTMLPAPTPLAPVAKKCKRKKHRRSASAAKKKRCRKKRK